MIVPISIGMISGSIMIAAHSRIALHGVRNRGCSQAKNRGSIPSRANPYSILGTPAMCESRELAEAKTVARVMT
jgi:hypothetical protein